MGSQDSPLFARVEREIPKLARQMLDRFVAEIPLYSMLPREQLDGEISAITVQNLRLFFASLRTDDPISDEQLVDIRSSAARRAEERVPLDAVLAAYHLGGRMGWDALVAAAEPGELDVLLVVAARVLEFVQQVTGAVASAYLEERQSIYGEERDALRAVASALLAGESADKLASRVGLTLAPSYVVLEVRIGEHPDEHEHGVGGSIAARRKLRRVQGRLERWAGQPVIGLLEPAGGPVLIATTPEDSEKVVGAMPELVHELAEAAGASVNAGAAVAMSIRDLAGAAKQAEDVLALAVGLGRGDGAYTLSDVLLEYQLSRPSDALPELGLLLEPLERNPDLVLTLETYLAHDLDRRGTAAALHVHPNTLDYRLRRVVELTGIDPATTRGLQLVGAALAARRLRGD